MDTINRNHRNTCNHYGLPSCTKVCKSPHLDAKSCTKCSEQRNRELAEVLGRLGISINEYAREFGLR